MNLSAHLDLGPLFDAMFAVPQAVQLVTMQCGQCAVIVLTMLVARWTNMRSRLRALLIGSEFTGIVATWPLTTSAQSVLYDPLPWLLFGIIPPLVFGFLGGSIYAAHLSLARKPVASSPAARGRSKRYVAIAFIVLTGATSLFGPLGLAGWIAADVRRIDAEFRERWPRHVAAIRANNPGVVWPSDEFELGPVQAPIVSVHPFGCIGPIGRARVAVSFEHDRHADTRDIFYLWIPGYCVPLARHPAVRWFEPCWGTNRAFWDYWELFPDSALPRKIRDVMKEPWQSKVG